MGATLFKAKNLALTQFLCCQRLIWLTTPKYSSKADQKIIAKVPEMKRVGNKLKGILIQWNNRAAKAAKPSTVT